MDKNLITSLVLSYPAVTPKGVHKDKKITFGMTTSTKLFHKDRLESAFNKIKEKYHDELAGMTPNTIKSLTWDEYKKNNPLTLDKIRSREKKEQFDSFEHKEEEDLNKDNITIVNPHIVNGSSALVLAGSFSGKTTLIVQAIKNILEHHRKRYDMIIIFSESVAALPLQQLPINDKIYILPVFIPQLISLLVNINQATNLRYSILIILDDVLKLKNEAVDKLLLVARNSGISTIISTQKVKGISPAARASVHNVYILGARNSGVRKDILNMYVNSYLVDRGIKKFDDQEKWLRENTRLCEDDRKLIKINTIEDTMSTHTIKK